MLKKVKKKKVTTDKPVILEGNFSQATDGMNGNRVYISVAHTINMGNYESIRVEYGQGRTVDDGQDFKIATTMVLKDVLLSIKDIIEIVKGSIK